MLAIQKYLQEHSVDELTAQYGVEATYHATDPLMILNYSQIASPKLEPLCREARGLTLETGTNKVVARAFDRFFRWNECVELAQTFDWSDFTCQSKEDGSLMLLYYYKNSWRVNTRGSFGLWPVVPDSEMTWEEAFYLACDEVGLDYLSPYLTYVFEFCSPYNQIVRQYFKPTLFLLTVFEPRTGTEPSEDIIDWYASMLHVERPKVYSFKGLEEIFSWLRSQGDETFEGVVLRDREGRRLKVKNEDYDVLHRLRGNGNAMFLAKNLLPYVLNGDEQIILDHWPQAEHHFVALAEKVKVLLTEAVSVYSEASNLASQKEFALYVLPRTKCASILFEARKRGVSVEDVFRNSESSILKLVGG